MGYGYIVNPLTNRKVSIHSRKGQSILREYVNQLGGANFVSGCRGRKNQDCPPGCKKISVNKGKLAPYTYCRKEKVSKKNRKHSQLNPEAREFVPGQEVRDQHARHYSSEFCKTLRNDPELCRKHPNCSYIDKKKQCRVKRASNPRAGPLPQEFSQFGGHDGPCVYREGKDSDKISYRSCHRGKPGVDKEDPRCVLITEVDGTQVPGRCRRRADYVSDSSSDYSSNYAPGSGNVEEHAAYYTGEHCKLKHQNYARLSQEHKDSIARECREDPNCTWTKDNKCRVKNKKKIRAGPVGRPTRGGRKLSDGPCDIIYPNENYDNRDECMEDQK